MEISELGKEIALGLINTGVEGGFGSVSCSTAGDYPSKGCSQWEGIGGRGDALLSYIDGGDHFIGRAYSDIEAADELGALSELLNSEQGQAAQLAILSGDCETYAQTAINAGLTDARCVIYAGMWGPTSTYVEGKFIEKRLARGYDIAADLDALHQVWHDQYTDAAGVGEQYRAGYENRADSTYSYVANLDLSEYGY